MYISQNSCIKRSIKLLLILQNVKVLGIISYIKIIPNTFTFVRIENAIIYTIDQIHELWRNLSW